MKEIKLFGLIFVLSIISGIVIETAHAGMSGGSSKGSFLSTDHFLWNVFQGVLVGGGLGILVGLILGGIFTIIVFTVGKGNMPSPYIIAFSFCAGLLEFGFYLNLLSATLPGFIATFRFHWLHLTLSFICGFFKVFIPLFGTKKYLAL